MSLAAIDVGQLFELAWASALAAIAVAVSFSLVLVGAARAQDCRRKRRAGSATAYAALSVLAGVVFIGIAVFAISVITTK
jgi:threonine/homoserine/homoserine lactone efflux protein